MVELRFETKCLSVSPPSSSAFPEEHHLSQRLSVRHEPEHRVSGNHRRPAGLQPAQKHQRQRAYDQLAFAVAPLFHQLSVGGLELLPSAHRSRRAARVLPHPVANPELIADRIGYFDDNTL